MKMTQNVSLKRINYKSSLKKYVVLWSVNQSKGYSNIDLLIKNCLLLSTIIIFPCFL
jgi:hypothetical protein